MAEPRAIKNHRQIICIQVVPLGLVLKKRHGLELNTEHFKIQSSFATYIASSDISSWASCSRNAVTRGGSAQVGRSGAHVPGRGT